MTMITPQHQRVGAHRARRNPLVFTVTAALAVVGLTAVLVWGLFAGGILGGDDTDTSQQAAAAATPGAAAEVDPSAEPTDGAAEPTDAGEATAAPAPEASAPASSETAAGGLVDKTASIVVLNGGVDVPGTARGLADRLLTSGWSGVNAEATTNAPGFPGSAQPTTSIVYSDPGLAATAEALAAEVGAGTAAAGTPSDYAVTSEIVVVMGSDLTP